MIPLSVLDLFPVSSTMAPTAAIHASVALAQRVEQLGYHRYWIAEHHNTPGIASSAPEILIGHVAGQTKRIRIGAGGMMLPNHAPLHVLEVFRTLEALYPARIDLGIGRAPGTDPFASSALKRKGSRGGDVNEQVAELLAFARGEFADDDPYCNVAVMPSDAAIPPIWMLGSTTAGANIAAAAGLPFAFAGHFSMSESDAAVAQYRARFRPSKELSSSRLMMAVAIVCGETSEHARDLALPLRVAFARMAAGRPAAFPTVAEAKAYRFSADELAVVERFAAGAIIGDAQTVREGLERLVERTRPDELIVSTVVPDPVERTASYERVAKLWGLTALEPAG